MTTRFCSNCGKPLQPDYQLCPYCGARVIASTVAHDGMYARVPLSRSRIALFAGLSVVILAFAIYIVIVDNDLTALLVGIFIVFLLCTVIVVFRPRATQPPSPRLP